MQLIIYGYKHEHADVGLHTTHCQCFYLTHEDTTVAKSGFSGML